MSADPRPPHPPAADEPPIGSPTLLRLCEELIALREANQRQHKLFEQALARARDELKTGFTAFTAETQRAYQHLREELHGEKRLSLTLLSELLEVGQDLEQLTAGRPAPDDREAVARWMEAVAVESRKVQDLLRRHGVHPYDAAVGAPYDPALHERVGGARVDGLGPSRVAEQRERGYASQQPEFVLRRPKVVVSE